MAVWWAGVLPAFGVARLLRSPCSLVRQDPSGLSLLRFLQVTRAAAGNRPCFPEGGAIDPVCGFSFALTAWPCPSDPCLHELAFLTALWTQGASAELGEVWAPSGHWGSPRIWLGGPLGVMLSGWRVDFVLSAISTTGVPYPPLSQCPPFPQPRRSHLSPLGAGGGKWICPVRRRRWVLGHCSPFPLRGWRPLRDPGSVCGVCLQEGSVDWEFLFRPPLLLPTFLIFSSRMSCCYLPPGRLDFCRFSLMRGCLPRSALLSVFPQPWQEGVWAGSLAPLVLQPMPRSVGLLLDAQGGETRPGSLACGAGSHTSHKGAFVVVRCLLCCFKKEGCLYSARMLTSPSTPG